MAETRPARSAMTAAPAEVAPPARPGLTDRLARRWPTAAAVAVSVPGFTEPSSPELVGVLAAAMLLLPLWYVVVEAVGRRSWTWPVLGVGLALFVGLQQQDRVAPAVVLAGLALVALLGGVVRGRLVRPSFLLQAAGLVAFGALAVTGVHLASAVDDPDLARYVVAAGWFAHGLWDLAHHRADAGVRRSGAEWCGVVDVLVAAQLVVVPLLL